MFIAVTSLPLAACIRIVRLLFRRELGIVRIRFNHNLTGLRAPKSVLRLVLTKLATVTILVTDDCRYFSFMSTSSRFAVAVHVLTLMAWAEEEPLKSEHVAESVNTNAVVIRRMLCELAESNLVVSQTGSMGGSKLARLPERITLLDIYQAVESRGVFSLHRHPPNPDCPVGVNIGSVLNDVLDEVDSAVEGVLANITLKDVVSRLRPCVSTANAKSVTATANGKRKQLSRVQSVSARN